MSMTPLATIAALSVCLMAGCGGSSSQPPTGTHQATNQAVGVAESTVRYEASNENFANPERGFAYENDPPWPDKITWGFCGQPGNFQNYDYTAWNDPLRLDVLLSERNQARSLIMSRYHVADFRDRALTADYLEFLRRDFATARQAGVKMIVRFAYNYPMGGPDAPLSRVLEHLEQLRPVLHDNGDVIAFVEAGFVGCWGEWHHSAFGLEPAGDDGGIGDAQRQILDKLLDVVPSQRMIAMRYPRQKFDYFGNRDLRPLAPLTEQTAFNGSRRARVGHHDDCFVCNETHGGSYWNPRGDFSETPNFIAQENLFVPQGGEPGDPETINPNDPGNANSPLSSCSTVLDEFASKHWSVAGLYNLNSATSAIKRWQRDGCWDEMNRRLGYRYRLGSSSVPQSASPGGEFRLTLEITNDGWTRPYNPRGLAVVLRPKSAAGADTVIDVQGPQDTRLLLPGPGETKSVELLVTLPGNTKPQTYELLLSLHDPAGSLRTRPEYSIRLANRDVWEPGTGFNKLFQTLEIRQ